MADFALFDSADRIRRVFLETAELSHRCADSLSGEIAQAARRMGQAILNGHKILACGNGGSSGDAQHFVGELVNRFERERLPLPAIALGANPVAATATANDYSFEEIFAREVQALGQAGDILLTLSTSGHSRNVIRAAETALHQGMGLVILTGRDGGELVELARCGEDPVICVDAHVTARVQEIHLLILHCLCMQVERDLFGCNTWPSGGLVGDQG